jgi:hypothetical protein
MRVPPIACVVIAGGLSVALPVAAGYRVDMACAIGPTEIGDPSSCSPVIACFEATGVYFVGRAIGWDRGTLAGTTSAGATCTGEWVSRNMLGVGQASFACDDGTSGTAFFTYQDGLTGTATGHGLSTPMGRLRVWSGDNIRQFLTDQTGEVDPQLFCGDVPIPMS